MSGRSRAVLLFGTDEAEPEMRQLSAGDLSVDLQQGNLGAVRWGGREVLRGIAFIVRDTAWGTYAPRLAAPTIDETPDRFRVTYSATVDGGRDGTFAYTAVIEGDASGALSFSAEGSAPEGFATCRTGLVVLHPLDGVAGRPVDIEHASGGHERSRFPELVAPLQPIFDIRALRHETVPGVHVSVRMEGDTFEMEDQRNWTDASFKTYVRPVAWGYPYRLSPGERVAQAVRVAITGGKTPISAAVTTGRAAITIGDAMGHMPRFGLFLPPAEAPALAAVAPRVAALAPAFMLGRADARRADCVREFNELADAVAAVGCPLALEIVIRGIAPVSELAPLAAAVADRRAMIENIIVFPSRDLNSRAPDALPDGEADAAAVFAAARGTFPGLGIGGGSPCGFAEFNRNRPPRGCAFATHASQALYHAADDVSVIQTLEALPAVMRSVRAIVGNIPYRIAPATIGLPRDWAAGAVTANPRGVRMTMAERDPRGADLYGAAFALGYAATAAREAVDALCLAAPVGAFGAFALERILPIGALIAGLAPLSGARRRAVTVSGTHKLAVLAAEKDDLLEVWIANLEREQVEVMLPVGLLDRQWIMDAASLTHFSPDTIHERPAGDTIILDSYAICRLRGSIVVDPLRRASVR